MANYTKEQLATYDNIMTERGAITDAKKEGIAEGRAEEILRIAKELKKDKMPVELIIKYTNLSMEEIQKL